MEITHSHNPEPTGIFCYSSGYEYWGKMESDGNVLSSGKKETVLRSNKKKIEKMQLMIS